MRSRPLEEIPLLELLEVGVWEYDLDEEDYTDEQDETWLRPAPEVPVDESFFGIFAVPVRLGNGQQIPAVLHCIDLQEPTKDNTAAGLTVEKDGVRCYDEFDVMAQFLGLSMDEVFPITYDLSAYAIGHPEAVRGVINRPPDYSYEPNFTGDEITRDVESIPSRLINKIPYSELEYYRVWQYDPTKFDDWVTPVSNIPVTPPFDGLFAIPLTLKSGLQLPGVIYMLNLDNPRKTKDRISFFVEKEGELFDYMADPDELAEFLQIDVDTIFPISYDISAYAIGHPEVLKGVIDE